SAHAEIRGAVLLASRMRSPDSGSDFAAGGFSARFRHNQCCGSGPAELGLGVRQDLSAAYAPTGPPGGLGHSTHVPNFAVAAAEGETS
ncbi:MAG: hypothetical protein OXQ29_10020, partial [Rhodospirillaceae bacterium]|nr:hypothetical protein [Rhodospirillaceae bacterium]